MLLAQIRYPCSRVSTMVTLRGRWSGSPMRALSVTQMPVERGPEGLPHSSSLPVSTWEKIILYPGARRKSPGVNQRKGRDPDALSHLVGQQGNCPCGACLRVGVGSSVYCRRLNSGGQEPEGQASPRGSSLREENSSFVPGFILRSLPAFDG